MESAQNAPGYSLDEAELALLKARDPLAQGRFFRAHRGRVEVLCARVLGHGADALEIATDVLGDFLFQYVDGVESPRAVSTYLKLMATRRSLRWLRTRGRSDEMQDDDGGAVELGREREAPVDQAIWARQMMPRLDGCLEQLTPKAREGCSNAILDRAHERVDRQHHRRLTTGSASCDSRPRCDERVAAATCLGTLARPNQDLYLRAAPHGIVTAYEKPPRQPACAASTLVRSTCP